MASGGAPLIEFEDGTPTRLSYNVPEPTSYSGRYYLELKFDSISFSAKSKAFDPPKKVDPDPAKLSDLFAKQAQSKALSGGVAVSRVSAKQGGAAPSSKKIMSMFASRPAPGPTAVAIGEAVRNGARIGYDRSMFGALRVRTLPPPPAEPRPRLMLVEVYRLSSFAGNYGAGRTLKTFSLLPGEKTTISIKTYKKTQQEAAASSSILDSFSQDSSDEFESSIQREQSTKSDASENFSYHSEAEADASFGFGSAKVSGGVSGGSTASREDFAKSVSSATEKHAMAASAKRDVQVNTTSSTRQEIGEETEIVRIIENINMSRTLNFVFRQMNQEFHTILHLVDVRVAFYNGYESSKREVALFELDDLLGDVVEGDASAVKKAILAQIAQIKDYEGKRQPFVVEESDGGSKFHRVNTELRATYRDHTVKGVILAANDYVMRTDAVIVEALLGRGEALDAYSQNMQEQAGRANTLNNDILKAELERGKMALEVVRAGNEKGAAIFKEVFAPPAVPKESK